MERLQKIIAESGYCSRREAEKLILSGKVKLNGKVITTLGTKAEKSDEIIINNECLKKEDTKVYYLLNKPRNVISSNKDEHNRTVVTDIIKSNYRIYPIGRLDYDTTGIILLTNDGEFANYLMHPKNNIPKTYLAKLEGIIDKDAINKLKKGVIIDNQKVNTSQFKLRKKDIKTNTSFIELTIIEGRNHIVKNIFKEIGYPVIKLSRIKYGDLNLGKLKSGEYRNLTIKEVKRFYKDKGNL